MPRRGPLGFSMSHYRDLADGWATNRGGGPAPDPPVNTALPVITGTARVGSTLTVGTGTWTNSPTSYAWQWKANGANISGATASTYAPVAGDIGKAITCTVTATNAGGAVSVTSAATAAIQAGPPQMTSAPVMSGTPAVGQVMSCTYGTWANNPTSYARRWQVNSADVSSAATYTIQAADVGKTIQCRIDVTNAGGSVYGVSNIMTVTA